MLCGMIVVNFSTKNYAMGQHRLSKSLNGYRQLMLNDYNVIGSPTHQESPYQFKVHAIEAAWKKDDCVLLADASMFRVGNIEPIQSLIENKGWYMEEAGHYCARWMNEHQKDYFKLTKEESTQGPGGLIMFTAGLFGLNKQNEKAREFLRQWKAAALAGCFRGSWENTRHDMTCAGIIAQRLGMDYVRGGTYMSYLGSGYAPPSETSVFYCQGLI
jgi:hypothetical protein